MKKALNWIAGLFRDEKGNPSSKRFVGIIAGLTLCITMYVNSYTHGDIKPCSYVSIWLFRTSLSRQNLG